MPLSSVQIEEYPKTHYSHRLGGRRPNLLLSVRTVGEEEEEATLYISFLEHLLGLFLEQLQPDLSRKVFVCMCVCDPFGTLRLFCWTWFDVFDEKKRKWKKIFDRMLFFSRRFTTTIKPGFSPHTHTHTPQAASTLPCSNTALENKSSKKSIKKMKTTALL